MVRERFETQICMGKMTAPFIKAAHCLQSELGAGRAPSPGLLLNRWRDPGPEKGGGFSQVTQGLRGPGALRLHCLRELLGTEFRI